MISIRNRDHMLTAYAQLLSKLPPSIYQLHEEKGFSSGSSPYAKSWLLVKILEAHRGEVVQISRFASGWQLIARPCPKPCPWPMATGQWPWPMAMAKAQAKGHGQGLKPV